MLPRYLSIVNLSLHTTSVVPHAWLESGFPNQLIVLQHDRKASWMRQNAQLAWVIAEKPMARLARQLLTLVQPNSVACLAIVLDQFRAAPALATGRAWKAFWLINWIAYSRHYLHNAAPLLLRRRDFHLLARQAFVVRLGHIKCLHHRSHVAVRQNGSSAAFALPNSHTNYQS